MRFFCTSPQKITTPILREVDRSNWQFLSGGWTRGVNNSWNAYDDNPNTYADGWFWGAGQGFSIDLRRSLLLGKIQLIGLTSTEGIDTHGAWGCSAGYGNRKAIAPPTNKKETAIWEEIDPTKAVSINRLDCTGYARYRIFDVRLWEWILA